jgi:cyclic beta-1,2-glucan synthetase
VQTEAVPRARLLLARRRPRAGTETTLCMALGHVGAGALEWETDRVRFVGRGRRRGAECGEIDATPLTGTTGNVLDPILALRWCVELEPGARAESAFWCGAPPDRDAALRLAERFAHPGAVAAAFAGAKAAAHALLEQLGLDASGAAGLQALAAAVLYGDPLLRASSVILERATGSAADLADIGIDPQRALVVVHAERSHGAVLVPALTVAQHYWHELALPIDLVIVQPGTAPSAEPGAPQWLAPETLAPGDGDLLDAVARCVLPEALSRLAAASPSMASEGPFPARSSGARTVHHRCATTPRGAMVCPHPARPLRLPPSPAAAASEVLRFATRYGGFAPEGDAYVVRVGSEAAGNLDLPPCPWINVLGNETFGCLLSETGAGMTWSGNQPHAPFDPVVERSAARSARRSVVRARRGQRQLVVAVPRTGARAGGYTMRHGFGRSLCRHSHAGLEQEVEVFVPRDAPFKATTVRIHNTGSQTRQLSLWSYARLVLGDVPEVSGRHIITWADDARSVLLARNPLATPFAGRPRSLRPLSRPGAPANSPAIGLRFSAAAAIPRLLQRSSRACRLAASVAQAATPASCSAFMSCCRRRWL